MTLLEKIKGLPASDPLGALRDGEAPVSVCFWWLDGDDPKLLYGWILAARGGSTGKWHKLEVLKSPHRIIRSGTTLKASDAYALVTALAGGTCLEEACKQLGIESPPVGDRFTLSRSYNLLPTALFTTSTALGEKASYAQGRQSPSSDAACWCARLATTAKFEGLQTEESDFDDALRVLLTALQRDTGLNFTGTGLAALGSIEVFSFPSLTHTQQKRVVIARTNQGQAQAVAVRLVHDPAPGEYLINVRAVSVQDVVFDELAPMMGNPPEASFVVPEPTDGATFRVWHKGPNDARWALWHEETHVYVRTFSFTMNMQGLSGALHSDWLDALSKTRAQSRAAELVKIQQVARAEESSTSTRADWEQAAIAARDLAKRLFRKPSGGRFFAKGWEGDSKISFAEWLRDQLSDHLGGIVLMDPYFDLPGLELVARASGAAKEIAVLTCTQISSDDDQESAPSRKDRLRAEAIRLQTILAGLGLRILDLQSSGGGSKALFHDRYVLFFDKGGRPTKGFNLSTSLQSATRTSPLLVTPIPADILDAVAQNVATLLEPDTRIAAVKTLYPVERPHPKERSNVLPEQVAIPILHFAATLLDDETCKDLHGRTAYERLLELGLVSDGKSLVVGTDEQLAKVAAFLETASLSDAATVWCGLCEADARSHANLVDRLAEAARDALCGFLRSYFPAVARGQAPGGLLKEGRIEATTLAHVFNVKFEDALEHAARLYDYHHAASSQTTWPKHFACRALASTCAGSADAVVNDLLQIGESANALLTAIASALTMRTSGQHLETTHSLLFASNPFLRAFGLVALWRDLQGGRINWDNLDATLANYNLSEKRLLLARAVSDLRVDANRRGRADNAASPLLDTAFTALLETFKDPVSDAEVRALLPYLSGPIEGSWSKSTHDRFLIPLQNRCLIDAEAPFRIWDAVLSERADSKDDKFYADTDVELINTWAEAIWSADTKERAAVIDRANRGTRAALRTLREPFIGTRDYARYRWASDQLLWWFLRLYAVEALRPSATNDQAFAEALGALVHHIDENEMIEAAIGQLQEVARLARKKYRESEALRSRA